VQPVSARAPLYWFVGVTVTSQIVYLVLRVRLPYEPQIVEWCNGSIPDSESDDDSSSLSSITNVGFSLFGKALHCECKEQGSRPGVNQKNKEQGTMNFE
jgi:hypothetical protein